MVPSALHSLITAIAVCSLCTPCLAEKMRVWQPIIDYTISFPGDRPDAAPTINPFENFTHMATDFGWMGPGGARIDARAGIIRVKPNGEWTGAWHSLAGLALDNRRTLDPCDLLQLGGAPEKKSPIRQLAVNASGHGRLRLELTDVSRRVVWTVTEELHSDNIQTYLFPIDPESIGQIKTMNWIAEPGCDLRLSSIGFIAERPDIPLEEWAFRISLGKLRRCHDPVHGFTRDRGHTPAGEFDTIAATGMHAIASALAATEGLISKEVAASEIETTIRSIEKLPKAAGFLPHFTHLRPDGKISIVPNTEFSTIDSAIALHSLMIATRILELDDLNQRVADLIFKLDFDAVTDSEDWIGHGFLDDAKTLLKPTWRDWGGETALVLMLEGMIPNRTPRGKMTPSGEPYRGVGFIAEIQSLFYPDFDRPEPDLISNISWPKVRNRILSEQKVYLKQHLPNAAAARAGIFGFSAGESGMPGCGYTANGSDIMGIRWIHPHYMFMGLGMTAPDQYQEGLQNLNNNQFLYPLGLPENIEVDLVLHNPMHGGLNAGFETLSSYHGWKKRNTPENRIDQATYKDPLLRKGASRFYSNKK